ncbi:hypothetical protein HZH68_001501 [Vespula germanica]|uniref:Uncharacterized protein n=1 Tax=Vespula germanica TaxID=30212 RepID=A0A834U6Y8_VESGE|nr:hypothetical protein HZH68_001501 [Vespula germanica]
MLFGSISSGLGLIILRRLEWPNEREDQLVMFLVGESRDMYVSACPMGDTFNVTLRVSLPVQKRQNRYREPPPWIPLPHLAIVPTVMHVPFPPLHSLRDKDSRWDMETETHA